MASDLSVSISVSAAVGGAISGLASLGRVVKTSGAFQILNYCGGFPPPD